MIEVVVALFVGAINGLLLGLVGGGGSILAVPALIYLLGQGVGAATTISLIVVGFNSAYGVLRQQFQNRLLIQWNYALALSITGFVGTQLGNWLNRTLPGRLTLGSFAFLMFGVAVLMLRPLRLNETQQAQGIVKPKTLGKQPSEWVKVGLIGLGLGFLTGLFGVGGGFLIVPALVLLLGFGMRTAAPTSLLIIALNSFSALIGRWPLTGFDPGLAAVLIGAGLVGTTIGGLLSSKLPEKALRILFAWLVIGLSFYVGWRSLF